MDTLKKITKSVALCGEDQDLNYKEIFTGFKFLYIPENHVGCALTCAPYVTLAQNAIPDGKQASDLMQMSINEWEDTINLTPLEEIPLHQKGFLGHDGIKKEYGITK